MKLMTGMANFIFFFILCASVFLEVTQCLSQWELYNSPYVETSFCRSIPGFSRQQTELCHREPDTTMVALEGFNEAVKECQYQFDGERWNCSSLNTKAGNPYASTVFQKGYKETAFAYAMSSAAVTILVARACSSSILKNCGCDLKSYRRQNKLRNQYVSVNGPSRMDISLKAAIHTSAISKGLWPNADFENAYLKENLNSPLITWKWGGCSHNFKYGIKFSKLFLDSRETADDIHARVNLHNNQLGRLVVKNNMHVNCKCHGISGSCQTMTCFRSAPALRSIGGILKLKFKSAVLVDQSSLGNERLRNFNLANSRFQKSTLKNMLTTRWRKRSNKKKTNLVSDLIYYQKSPNYCDKDMSLELPGTSGRLCNSNNTRGPNSCTTLCCGRGYHLVKRKQIQRCKCKFIWCCKVECAICTYENWISICK